MGFGGVQQQENSVQQQENQVGQDQQQMFQAEDNLTNLQGQVNLFGANNQQQAADAEAQAQFDQANYAIAYSAQQAAQTQYGVNLAAGNQMEGYAAGGVEEQGTPLSVVNSTRALGAIEVNNIDQQGSLEASLLRTQAFYTQQQGLDAVLGAEGQNMVSQGQNLIQQNAASIQQAQNQVQVSQSQVQLSAEEQQAKASMFGQAFGLGTGLVSAGLGLL